MTITVTGIMTVRQCLVQGPEPVRRRRRRRRWADGPWPVTLPRLHHELHRARAAESHDQCTVGPGQAPTLTSEQVPSIQAAACCGRPGHRHRARAAWLHSHTLPGVSRAAVAAAADSSEPKGPPARAPRAHGLSPRPTRPLV